MPRLFVKTKAVTHQLLNDSANRPEGWSPEFAERISETANGVIVMTIRMTQRAAKKLLTLFVCVPVVYRSIRLD